MESTHLGRCVCALACKSFTNLLCTELCLMCLVLVNVTADASQGNSGQIKALTDRTLAVSGRAVAEI